MVILGTAPLHASTDALDGVCIICLASEAFQPQCGLSTSACNPTRLPDPQQSIPFTL